ncbi:MAG: methyltransferase domain-containing protein [Pseudomonadales bacterium]|nr:methyltransferase domain-containing protein [Pseudomonadales bacterium]
MTDVVSLNRKAWDTQSIQGDSRWVQPISSSEVAAARAGQWSVILTPTKAVPAHWFGEIAGKEVLALASGGGQQVPTLAAAGASVTSFDNSPAQLQKDRDVADRDGLDIQFEQGDMADLTRFPVESFDLIFHPVSNVFAENVTVVWQECARVLKPGGRLLAGFMKPDLFLFDHEKMSPDSPIEVVFELPYSDLDHLSDEEISRNINEGEALEFGHSLEDQIGGQIAAGFVVAGFYEDRWSNEASLLNRYMPTSMATLAIKNDPAIFR